VTIPERGDGRTVSGLLVALAGERVPTAGERFDLGQGILVEVVEASPRRVRVARVRVVLPPA
jgi:putative hemolysin